MTSDTFPRRAWVEHIMGMPISLHLRGEALHEATVEREVSAVFAELRRADEVLSPYKVDSDLRRWWQGEIELGEADPLLERVLVLCQLAWERTDGYFSAWSLPDPHGDGVMFDPSGLVKGWAVEQAARHLLALPEHGWCLNAGGDVLVHAPADQPAWRVGIEDPNDRSRVLRALSVRSGAVATSGTARRGAHIVNPHSGEPVAGLVAITVVGPTLCWADVLATAAIARGPGGLDWLEEVDGYEAVTASGRATSKFSSLTEDTPCSSS